MPKTKILERYKVTCNSFELTHDEDSGKTYIHTERFDASPVLSDKARFDDFSDELRALYKTTFADPAVMEKFATGQVYSVEDFEGLVARHSLRASHKYPFSAFIVTDKENDNVVGFEVIGNGEKDGAGEVAYLFRKDYARGAGKQNVGYENVGALIWGYGEELYTKKALVNQNYDKTSDRFIGGQDFTKVRACLHSCL